MPFYGSSSRRTNILMVAPNLWFIPNVGLVIIPTVSQQRFGHRLIYLLLCVLKSAFLKISIQQIDIQGIRAGRGSTKELTHLKLYY